MRKIEIENRKIGPEEPCFVIAEAGVNHNGDLAQAFRLVDAAVAARADAVKFQTFNAERLISRIAPKAAYQLETTDGAESQYEMLKRLELTAGDHRRLQAYCTEQGILFLSTPFDEESADFLSSLRLPAFKISSGEVTNLPFLEHLARTGLPLILSTGMSSLTEVEAAVAAIRRAGGGNLALLQCVSDYPANPADANLRAMRTLAEACQVPVGFSDHTLGWDVTLAAVALGACIIEKHLTLDKKLPGPDHRASLDPEEFRQMMEAIRRVESALGDGRKEPRGSETCNTPIARKSLHWRETLAAGEVIGAAHLIALRPGTGLPPSQLPTLVGRRLKAAVEAGQMVREVDFAE